MNLTKTIRKTPVDLNLETAGVTYVEQGTKQQPKYDDEDKWVSWIQLVCQGIASNWNFNALQRLVGVLGRGIAIRVQQGHCSSSS